MKEEEEPDIIVIAGDLYDTTYPSKDANHVVRHKRLES